MVDTASREPIEWDGNADTREPTCGSDAMRAVNGPGRKRKAKAALLGVGLDNDDDQVRITRGPNFHLLGGSHDTHRQMQEKCIKLNEKLKGRGKQLEDLQRGEFLELAHECDMHVAEPECRGR